MLKDWLSRYTIIILGTITAAAVGLLAWASPGTATASTSNTSVLLGHHPVDKRFAPPTDLKDYPKRPVGPVNPALWGEPGRSTDVISMHVASDGSGKATYYTPVRGENAAELYAILKAHGIRGLVKPGALPASTAMVPNAVTSLTSCKYGTAQTFRCSTDTNVADQIRWADGCCAHPQVWFVDHTGSQWPVTNSTWEWNEAHGVDSIYVWATCPNYSGQHCVNVTDTNAGCSGWEGLTNVSWSSSYYMTSASVQLNDYNGTCTSGGYTYYYNKNSYGYRQDACHEMGHALGMGHNSSTGSCLYATIINSSGAQLPDSNDFTLIAKLYDDGNE